MEREKKSVGALACQQSYEHVIRAVAHAGEEAGMRLGALDTETLGLHTKTCPSWD